ncbi:MULTISPECIES: ATP-binding protein [Kitasatospora]|uniref:histidine kinase n=1 Tax=Kitasatospora setae (strain ATCC 33774 / DSM 43861 / JCM 3304 / KCC A-0304 / NBRC 14216 / KM-6054) TaxID=452652 RepID=E4N583_KITSK|nr:ATP-binding protein [Kitasatospora setae]BAJ26364.1 putative two-component hybrid sensor and regulator [Kitasatospora setae KM-6054]
MNAPEFPAPTEQAVPPVHLETVPVGNERDTFGLRRGARAVADLLGVDGQDAVRLATALSELGRGLLGADRLAAAFDLVPGPPAALRVTLAWRGGHRLPAEALEASGRLLPTHHEYGGGSGLVRVEQRIGPVPGTLPDLAGLARDVLAGHTGHTGPSAREDSRSQTRDLIAALEHTRAQREELLRLNSELEETNRGVLALYSELSEELEETNRGVVALYAELDEKSRQLRDASEAKSRFWANVSHELRTPVNAVVGLAELLRTDADAPAEERARQLSLIADSGRTLLALVDELLDVAKAESGTLEPQWAPLDLRAVLSHLEGTLRGLARPGVALRIGPAPDGTEALLGDETMLVRVLRNLLSNALKFTEHGSVRLDAVVEPHPDGAPDLVLTVSDTGVGIPADQHERVFEEFYQVRGPHQRGRRGTGLGLPYARRLTEILGGTLHLDSVPGRGTSITVRLPVHPVPPAGARLALLVAVDDDPVFREVLRPVLHGIADRVLEVPDGAGALGAIRAARPDGVVLDLHLGPVDGYQVLAGLRADPALRQLPVVVLTSASLSAAELGRLSHARAVLPKSALDGGRIAAALSAPRPAVPRRPLPPEDGS